MRSTRARHGVSSCNSVKIYHYSFHVAFVYLYQRYPNPLGHRVPVDVEQQRGSPPSPPEQTSPSTITSYHETVFIFIFSYSKLERLTQTTRYRTHPFRPLAVGCYDRPPVKVESYPDHSPETTFNPHANLTDTITIIRPSQYTSPPHNMPPMSHRNIWTAAVHTLVTHTFHQYVAIPTYKSPLILLNIIPNINTTRSDLSTTRL